MCILFSSKHPAVLSSGHYASVMRDVGSLVAQISVPRHGVFPLLLDTATESFAHPVRLLYI
jgi:hypothetical protein